MSHSHSSADNENHSAVEGISRRQLLTALGSATLMASGAWAAGSNAAAPSTTPATPKNNRNTPDDALFLSDLDLTLVDQQWNMAQRDQAMSGKPLSIGGKSFARGVGTHAESRIVVHLDHSVRRFLAFAGIDDGGEKTGSARFAIEADGRLLWDSGVRRRGDGAVPVDLDVSKVRYLVLRVDNGGDGNWGDHADWAAARFEGIRKRPTIVAQLPIEEGIFRPGRLWVDTKNRPIQAHGGGIMRHKNQWWWHGEDRSNGYIAIGASAYVSSDLMRWRRVGLALPRAAYDQKHGDQTLCERPKVVFNRATGQFVMWFHYDRSGYGDSRAGVAVSQSPGGPFQFLGAIRPIESSTFRDMNLWVDDDGRAYVFYAGEGNQTMHVVRLNAQWTAPETPMVEGQTWARILVNQSREAPAPFKHQGKYFLLTSGCSGWAANKADLAVADSPLGPYRSLGNPCVGEGADQTFGTQSTFVLPTPGAPAGHFLFLADRWKPEALADARYVWLPFQMQENNTKISWTPRWKLNSRGAVIA